MRVVNGIDIRHIGNVKAAHKGHFFDKDTMQFWQSIVYSLVFADRFFVTSDIRGADDIRTFNVHELTDSGRINAVNGHQYYNTLTEAYAACAMLADVRGSIDHNF